MATMFFENKESIPEEFREEAKEVAEGENKGKFSINVVSRARLDEFRNNNTNLSKEKETLAERLNKIYGVLDANPDEFDADEWKKAYDELKSVKRQVDDGKLKGSTDVEAELTRRTDAMRKRHDEETQQFQKKIAEANAKAESFEKMYKRTFIDRGITNACMDDTLGVHPSAIIDITRRAYEVFVVDEKNNPIPKRDGQTIWGEDGATPMSFREWIDGVVRKEAPHYFKQSNGGGAGGGGSEKFGGITEKDFNAMTGAQQLAWANKMRQS